jgi:hypothetical protein
VEKLDSKLKFTNLPLQVNTGKIMKRNLFLIGLTLSLTLVSLHADITNGLVTYYPFNGDANDLSGMSNHLVVTGASLVTDRFGNSNSAYYFNGVSDWMVSQNILPISNDMPRTISVWFRSEDANFYIGMPTIVGFGHMNTTGDLFDLRTGKSRTIYLHSHYQSSQSTTNLVTDNFWYHLVVTTTGSVDTLRAYLNGVEIALPPDESTNATYKTTAGKLRISTFNDTGGISNESVYWWCQGFKGWIDDVRVYNRALSAQDVQGLYQFESGLGVEPRTATAAAQVVNGFLVGATVTDEGAGYTNTPTVRIIGDGSGAEAVATVSNGVVIAVNILDAGYGYTETPQLIIDPPFIFNPVLQIAPMTFLSFSNLTVSGVYQLQRSVAWYWENQPVNFTATNTLYTQLVMGVAGSEDYRLVLSPAPSQAFATAQVVNGFVVGGTVTSGGSGYLTNPAVGIVGGGGTNAAAVSQISGGVVTSLTITSAGINYTNTPTIIIDQPPAASLYPSVLPMMRLDSSRLAPYENYQIQFKPTVGTAWNNWNDGMFIPTAATNSQYLFITNPTGFFRLRYLE